MRYKGHQVILPRKNRSQRGNRGEVEVDCNAKVAAIKNLPNGKNREIIPDQRFGSGLNIFSEFRLKKPAT